MYTHVPQTGQDHKKVFGEQACLCRQLWNWSLLINEVPDF